MVYKIIAGPEQMYIVRYGLKSEPIDICDEYITLDNQKAKDFYYEHMHSVCQEYMKLKWNVKCVHWDMLHEDVKEIVEKFPTMYFDGPSWICSVVPWKQAKYKEWFIIPNKLRWLLKKEYTDGIRNR